MKADKLKSCSIMDVKLIMLQIIEGLSFLHNDAKIVHLNLSPDNIYVTA
jgi:serine/threonine protein kinase